MLRVGTFFGRSAAKVIGERRNSMWNGKDAERPQIVTTQSVVTRESYFSDCIAFLRYSRIAFQASGISSRRGWVFRLSAVRS